MAGLQLLDQCRFTQQRTNLAGGGDPLNAPHLLRQFHFLTAGDVGSEVRHDAFLQRLAFAHIQRHIVVAIKQIDAMPFR